MLKKYALCFSSVLNFFSQRISYLVDNKQQNFLQRSQGYRLLKGIFFYEIKTVKNILLII